MSANKPEETYVSTSAKEMENNRALNSKSTGSIENSLLADQIKKQKMATMTALLSKVESINS